MDPSRGQYSAYGGTSTTYPSSAYSAQSQSSYNAQSSASNYYPQQQQSYPDSSGGRGSYYSPQTSTQPTYPMRQQMGYNSTDSYQYGGDYSSMAQSSYSAPGSAQSRSTFRGKRPRDDSSRFDEPRPKRQDTRSERSGPSSHRLQASPPNSRWSRGGRGGGSSSRGGTRGRGRGRGRGGDDRSSRAPYPSPHLGANSRGGRMGRGGRGRGGRGRDGGPSPSSRFYSRDNGSRDYSYDDAPSKSYDKDRRAPPPPRRSTRSPVRSSPRQFPSRQPPESTRSSHRRSRTLSKSPSRQKDDVIRLMPQSVLFASATPGSVDEHPLLSCYFADHPGLHLTPELSVGMEDFLFKVSLMESNKRKVRKRESAIAEAEVYKRDIIVCWLFSDGDSSNLWLPASEFVKLEEPVPPATEQKDGEDAPMAEQTAPNETPAENKENPAAEGTQADVETAPRDSGTENKTTDVVVNNDADAGAADTITATSKVAPMSDAGPAAVDTVDENNNNGGPTNDTTQQESNTQEHQGNGETDPKAESQSATVLVDDDHDSEPMDVDDSADDVIVTGDNNNGLMDVDSKQEATESASKKITRFTVVFGLDHCLRADSESKMNHDFLSRETLDETRVVVVHFGLDSAFGSDADGKLSTAQEAKRVFERLLTTGPLKKQSFRNVASWDTDPTQTRSFQKMYPKMHQAMIQYYQSEQENDKVDKLREDNASLKSKNASLKKALESARAKVEKYEKMVGQVVDLCENVKK